MSQTGIDAILLEIEEIKEEVHELIDDYHSDYDLTEKQNSILIERKTRAIQLSEDVLEFLPNDVEVPDFEPYAICRNLVNDLQEIVGGDLY